MVRISLLTQLAVRRSIFLLSTLGHCVHDFVFDCAIHGQFIAFQDAHECVPYPNSPPNPHRPYVLFATLRSKSMRLLPQHSICSADGAYGCHQHVVSTGSVWEVYYLRPLNKSSVYFHAILFVILWVQAGAASR
jgi:hypothetical protein